MTQSCMGVCSGAMHGPVAVWCTEDTAMVVTGWPVLATRPVVAVAAGVVPLRHSSRVVVAMDAGVPLAGPARVAVVAVVAVASVHDDDVEG